VCRHRLRGRDHHPYHYPMDTITQARNATAEAMAHIRDAVSPDAYELVDAVSQYIDMLHNIIDARHA
jgi:hypothetical protein